MFERIKNYFAPNTSPPQFHPAVCNVFKDKDISDKIYTEGYYIVNLLDDAQQAELLSLYAQEQHYEDNGDGAFVDVMSERTNQEISRIIDPSLKKWLTNYKIVASTFVVKTPGDDGTVPAHQDGTTTDELRYTTLNVWIPLQTIDASNGGLHIVPRSHHISVPYRCATIEPYIKAAEQALAPYFVPVYMRPGQALIFDSRMFHYSPTNKSAQDRIASVSRIFPFEADFIMCYKDKITPGEPIEIWRCPDNHLIKSNYSHNQAMRPKGCTLIDKRYMDTTPISLPALKEALKKLRIEPHQPAIKSE